MMQRRAAWISDVPPRPLTGAGDPRRVGVEIEFAAVSPLDAAALVQDRFGGRVEARDANNFAVAGTEFGRFDVALDWSVLKAPDDAAREGGLVDDVLEAFRAELAEPLGAMAANLVPCEIVCPPIAHDRLGALDRLVGALRGAGAQDTRASPLFGFGLQLNVEIPDDDARWIGRVVTAYALASDWLRAEIGVDITRRVLPFADAFPDDYVDMLAETEPPGAMADLIDGYLAFNPTRNRELDLLPLFAWADGPRVRAVVDDPRVKPRPTFHYRLPDCRLADRDWSVTVEWRRWLAVERLADDTARLAGLKRAWIDYRAGLPWPGGWLEKSRPFLEAPG